jgi:hypothetical protein
MQVATTALWTPKAGNRPDECEDALFPARSGRLQGDTLCLAVADGASEALLSGPWAEVLVRAYGRAGADLPALLPLAQAVWRRWLRRYLWRRAHQGRPVQWFEEPGLEAGAFAALVGLTLVDGVVRNEGDWRATALGDCCLFQVRAGALLASFPIERASDFGSRPLLLASRADGNHRLLAAQVTQQGAWRAGDRFYLMSDALAQWWLVEYGRGLAPWRALDRLCRPGASRSFGQWIEVRRKRRQLRNDDVALLRVALLPESPPPCPGPS